MPSMRCHHAPSKGGRCVRVPQGIRRSKDSNVPTGLQPADTQTVMADFLVAHPEQ